MTCTSFNKILPLFFIVLWCQSCQNDPKPVPVAASVADTVATNMPAPAAVPETIVVTPPAVMEKDTVPAKKAAPAAPKRTVDPATNKATPAPKPAAGKLSGFTDIESLDKSILLDIRYATTDNFTKAQIYDCPKCYLRPEAATAIAKAHKALQEKKMGLKMFDCYRPRPYQQRLWDKVPDPNYVTPPAKGSMHGRGAAVDLTIVDENGKELDMGTAYDFFGEKAHYDYTNLPAKVLANRKMLRETLEAVGFKGIRTEWWHFSYQGKDYPLSETVWECKK